MKTSKRLTLVLALLMALSTFTACGKGSTTESSTPGGSSNSSTAGSDNTTADDGKESTPSESTAEPGAFQLPIVDEKIEVTWFAGMVADMTTLVENLNETPFFQELEARTNIHINFDHPAAGNEATAYNLLFASGDLPDMISHQAPGYPGGLDACIDDGYILDLTDLVEQNCPNYMAAINSFSDTYDENVRRSAYTGSGRMGAVGQLMQRPQAQFAGMYVRGDWLEDCGLDTPVTFDDWEEMLTAFKDQKGATAPLLLYSAGYDNYFKTSLCAGFGVTSGWFQEDGKVKFGPAQEGWREYVTLMHDWYEKGLIDPDFMTSTEPIYAVPNDAMIAAQKTGAFMGIYTNVPVWEASIEGDDDANFVPVYTPMKNEGDTHDFQNIILSGATPTMGLSISATSEYPVECLKMFDYFFTEEGALLCNWGIEGDTFEFDADGEPHYTDKIKNNPDGLTTNQAMAYYTCPPARPVYQAWFRELEFVPEKDVVCYDIWGAGTNSKSMPDPSAMSMDPELYSDYSKIMTDVQTVVDEKTPQFISGVLSLDEYDAYLETINSFGMEDAVEIVQQAYDAFMAR